MHFKVILKNRRHQKVFRNEHMSDPCEKYLEEAQAVKTPQSSTPGQAHSGLLQSLFCVQ